MKITLHSDDLGITRGANAGMIDAWKSGGLDSMSVLANGVFLDEAAAALASQPERPLRLSVHLNLFEGPCTAEPSEVNLLINKRGHFRYTFATLWAALCFSPPAKRAMLLTQIAHEWQSQIERVKNACAPRTITALDGHRHVQMLPHLNALTHRLAAEHHLRVRNSREFFFTAQPARDLFSISHWQNVAKWIVLHHLSRQGRSTSQAIVGILYSGCMTRARAQAGIHAAQAHGVNDLELVFHVGRAQPQPIPEFLIFRDFYESPWRMREYDEIMALRAALTGDKL